MDFKQAIDAAIEAHSQWFARLKQAIETGKSEFNPEVVKTDNNCAFGKWLYNEYPEAEKQKPAYEEIKKLHAKFHVLAANILTTAIQGKKESAIKQMDKSGEFYTLSGTLVLRLMQLKK